MLQNSQIIIDRWTIKKAVKRMGNKLNDMYFNTDEKIVVMPVLTGGMVFAADLIRRLQFPYHVSPIMCSRYGNNMKSDLDLTIHQFPSSKKLLGKTVIVVDDIMDDGVTMYRIVEKAYANYAKSVHPAVLINRSDEKVGTEAIDHCFRLVEDKRFLFGYGMDLHGEYRGLKDIWALSSH